MNESKTPKVTNPPKRIWLNFGEIEEDVDFSDLRDGESITWCEGAQDDADVEYMLASELAEALAERDALAARVEKAEADARRYRWLRASGTPCTTAAIFQTVSPLEIDAKVDAALSREEKS